MIDRVLSLQIQGEKCVMWHRRMGVKSSGENVSRLGLLLGISFHRSAHSKDVHIPNFCSVRHNVLGRDTIGIV